MPRIGAVTAVLLLSGACSGDDGRSGADDTGLPAGIDDAPWFCDDGSYALTDGVVETEHYRLTLALDDEEAAEVARLAEAAYAAFADYFGAEPADPPLVAGWYADEASWRAAIEADGTTAPDAGGYYWPPTRTARMFTQPTVYFSRMLFLHELAHQFHFLARTGNESRAGWYVEGAAEYLSRHDWDGRCARLGRLPWLTWEDYPAQALAEGGFAFDGSSDLSRPWAWAFYRFLEQADPLAFDAFRTAYDADATVAFSDHFDVPATVAAVEAWLPGEQELMAPVFLDWLHVSDTAVDGEAVWSSLAVAKQGDAITMSHAAPATGSAGIVAGYQDSANFSAWMVDGAGGLWTFVSTDGSALWWSMGSVPEAERYAWSLSGTTVTVNGESFEETNGFAPRGGLALYGDAIRFEDLSL